MYGMIKIANFRFVDQSSDEETGNDTERKVPYPGESVEPVRERRGRCDGQNPVNRQKIREFVDGRSKKYLDKSCGRNYHIDNYFDIQSISGALKRKQNHKE